MRSSSRPVRRTSRNFFWVRVLVTSGIDADAVQGLPEQCHAAGLDETALSPLILGLALGHLASAAETSSGVTATFEELSSGARRVFAMPVYGRRVCGLMGTECVALGCC